MPELGDIKRRDQIGLAGRSKMIYAACPECGARRWTMYSIYRKRDGQVLCRSCGGKLAVQRLHEWRENGEHRPDCRCSTCNPPNDQWAEDNPSWSGGVTRKGGYRAVLLSPDSQYWEMAMNDRYVLEHRLVIAKELGRPLKEGETVHHIDGDKDNNDIENLELWYTNHGHGVRVADLLEDWAKLHNYHCPGCNKGDCYDE